ncbi:MAG TPA: O-antigen ligase family protein [Methyloceanibacter sp.]|nr:O-antigen ligase family protein [Methyloceanibacter sp.]
MSSSAAAGDGMPFRGGPLIPILFFITPLFTAASPRTAPFFLPIIAALLIIAALRRGLPWRDLLKPNAALFALLAVSAYAGLTAIWAADPEAALSKCGLLLATTLVVFAASAAIPTLDAGQVRRASQAFIAGAFCAAGFVAIELLSDGAITRAAMNTFPAFRPERAKHVTIHHDRVTKINLSEFNQDIAILALLLWPGLLALKVLDGPRRKLLTVLFFLVLAVPIAISEHDSSQVGLIASLLILALAWVNPRAVVRGLAIAWCLGFVLVIPLDFLAFKADLHQAKWLPMSARARIIIWEYTAERVLEKPLLGIGADSTPATMTKPKNPSDKPKGFVIRRTTGQHAHNLFLQSWYELGALGVILAAIAGAGVALRILLLPAAAQAYGAASFTMVAVIAAFAWGMWQIWLICAVGLLPLYLLMPAALLRPPDDGERAPASR